MGLRGLNVAFLFFFIVESFAAGEFSVIGAKAAGMGFSSVAGCDEWSAFNNPGGLAHFRSYSAGVYLENRFLVREISLKALAVTIPAWKGALGLVILHFGYAEYNEIKGGVAYGLPMGKYFSAGVQLSCLRINQSEGYGSRNILSCEIGFHYNASDHLSMGVHIVNPVSTRISEYSKEKLPAMIRFGLLWKIPGNLSTALEAEKDTRHPLVLRAGAEYHPGKHFFARFGIASGPTIMTLGAGFETGPFRFDLAAGYNPRLGYSPQASLTYKFR